METGAEGGHATVFVLQLSYFDPLFVHNSLIASYINMPALHYKYEDNGFSFTSVQFSFMYIMLHVDKMSTKDWLLLERFVHLSMYI